MKRGEEVKANVLSSTERAPQCADVRHNKEEEKRRKKKPERVVGGGVSYCEKKKPVGFFSRLRDL